MNSRQERFSHALQFEVAHTCLEAIGRTGGFALAGSGAIREHELISRPTEDVDLFTTHEFRPEFQNSIDRARVGLEARGFTVEVIQRLEEFCRLRVEADNGQETLVDMAMDWRENPPTVLDVGQVLALDDAVRSKVLALYSRGEARDFLDVAAVVEHGWQGARLLELAEAGDPGFDRNHFAHRLREVVFVDLREVEPYEVTREELEAIQRRLVGWADAITQGNKSTTRNVVPPQPWDEPGVFPGNGGIGPSF